MPKQQALLEMLVKQLSLEDLRHLESVSAGGPDDIWQVLRSPEKEADFIVDLKKKGFNAREGFIARRSKVFSEDYGIDVSKIAVSLCKSALSRASIADIDPVYVWLANFNINASTISLPSGRTCITFDGGLISVFREAFSAYWRLSSQGPLPPGERNRAAWVLWSLSHSCYAGDTLGEEYLLWDPEEDDSPELTESLIHIILAFTFLHELGHVHLGHIQKSSDFANTPAGVRLVQEVSVDEWAFRVLAPELISRGLLITDFALALAVYYNFCNLMEYWTLDAGEALDVTHPSTPFRWHQIKRLIRIEEYYRTLAWEVDGWFDFVNRIQLLRTIPRSIIQTNV